MGKERLKFLEPYGAIVKSFLTNLAVGSLLVGLFQGDWFGVPVGVGLFVCALLWVFIEERYIK